MPRNTFRVRRWFFILLLLAAVGLFAWRMVARADRNLRADLLQQSLAVARTLNLGQITALTGSPVDLEIPAYRQLKEHLIALRSTLQQCRFLYLMDQKPDGTIFFLVDSEPVISKDYSPPGQVYAEVPAGYRRVFATRGASVEGPFTDRWGIWVSGVVPLVDAKSGELLAVLGMDIDARDWKWKVAAQAALPVGVVLVICMGAATAFVSTRRHNAPRNLAAALGLLTAGLFVTGSVAVYAKRDAEGDAQRKFEFAGEQIRLKIVARLHACAQLLQSGTALFDASVSVEREEWKVFVEGLQVEQQLPGVQGIGFAQMIPRAQLAAHLEAIRREGFGDYQVKPAGDRETYSSIVFLEPFTGRNLRAFGYDMLAEPVRRAAMERARDEHDAALSGKVTLVQETNEEVQAGVLMYVPVYRHGLPIGTVEQRRAAIQGWVYSPYRMGDLMRGILRDREMQPKDSLIDLQVYDGEERVADSLLFDTQSAKDKLPATTALVTRQVPIDFAGHRWTLCFTQLGGLAATADYNSVWLACFGGTIISLLLFSLTLSLLGTRASAERMAERLTKDLRTSEQSYRNQFANNSAVMLLVDPATGAVLDANAAALSFYGYSRENLLTLRTADINTLPADEVRAAMSSVKPEEGRRFEFQHRLADGSLREVEVSSSRIEFGGRTVLHSIIHDITARKHAEVALRQTAERLALATRAGGVGIWDYDVVGNRLTWDDQMFRLYGIQREQFSGEYAAWQAGVHPEDRPRWDEEIQLALRGEKEFDTEFRVLWPDGSIRTIRALASVERDHAERPARIFGTNWDITEQKYLEAKLKSGEENFRNFFETIGDMILVATPEGQILFANHALKRELGYTDEEIARKHVLDFNPEDKHREAEQIFAAMLRGERKSCPLPLVTKQGGHIPAETRVWMGQWNGKDCLFGVSKDLRQELEAQNRFERLFRHNPALMALTTIPGRQFSDVNDSFVEVLGYSPAEVLGKTAKDIGLFVQPEQQAEAAEKMRKEGRMVGFEMKLRRKDGKILDGLFSGEIISTQGHPVTLTVMIDITALKQASERLSKLSQAVEFSPSMIVITDRLGQIEYVNPAWVQATGYSLEEAVGQSPRLVKSGLHPVEFYQEMWTEILAGRIWRGEICNRTKSGRLFWESAAVAPVQNESSGITHFVGVKEDITARKQAAEELRLAKGAAEAANRAKSTFLANMSHEIRTPMNAILGFSQLMLRDAALTVRQLEHLTTITRSGQHLLEIINAVLEMARIETGRVNLQVSSFDLHLLLKDLERLFRLRADTENLQLRFERQGEVARYVQTDPTKLRQVFINLLSNALKFTPRGGTITVRLQTEQLAKQELCLRAEVQDTGAGIAPEELPHLFQPFFQTQTGKQVGGGTGLGLALSREFVQALGGELTVTSQLGVGSTFQFYIQMASAEASAATEDAPPPRVLHLRSGQPVCRVLLVDDQRENSTLLEQLLVPLGFETRTVENGAEAVAQCQIWPPNLVLMDMMMPVMDGCEAAQRIRAAHGNAVKIIILSASIFPEAQKRALQAGTDAFVGKPFKEEVLLERIKELTGVEFDYADAETDAIPPAKAPEPVPTADEIRRLPVELVDALREATCRAEYGEMLELASQAATHDERLGRELRLLIERFDYSTLQRILTTEEHSL